MTDFLIIQKENIVKVMLVWNDGFTKPSFYEVSQTILRYFMATDEGLVCAIIKYFQNVKIRKKTKRMLNNWKLT